MWRIKFSRVLSAYAFGAVDWAEDATLFGELDATPLESNTMEVDDITCVETLHTSNNYTMIKEEMRKILDTNVYNPSFVKTLTRVQETDNDCHLGAATAALFLVPLIKPNLEEQYAHLDRDTNLFVLGLTLVDITRSKFPLFAMYDRLQVGIHSQPPEKHPYVPQSKEMCDSQVQEGYMMWIVQQINRPGPLNPLPTLQFITENHHDSCVTGSAVALLALAVSSAERLDGCDPRAEEEIIGYLSHAEEILRRELYGRRVKSFSAVLASPWPIWALLDRLQYTEMFSC